LNSLGDLELEGFLESTAFPIFLIESSTRVKTMTILPLLDDRCRNIFALLRFTASFGLFSDIASDG
jgi:hypothetical protein